MSGKKRNYKNDSSANTTSDCVVDGKDTARNNNRSNSRNGRNGRGKYVKGSNDPAWYANNAQLLRDAASIPFSWAIGTPIDLAVLEHDSTGKATSNANQVIPGICALEVVPTIGHATSATDPVNIASTSVYSFIRHANSGHANYDSPDLMCYLTAMTQVYSYIVFLQRVYSSATLYAQGNRYLPKGLLVAMHVSDSSVTDNLANFRYGINALIDKAASLAVPATMSIFRRSAFMYQNVYAGGNTVKDQLYLYTPKGFLRYDPLVKEETNDAGSSGLVYMPLFKGSTALTYSQLIQYGNDLLSPILSSEDMNIMSGDILKAYGANSIIKLSPLPERVEFAPIFNGMVLEQMKNATIVNASYDEAMKCIDGKDGYKAVVQDGGKGYLKSKLTTTHTTMSDTDSWAIIAARGNKVLTTMSPDPTPEIVMEITRLVARADDGSGLYVGSEVVAGMKIYYPTITNGIVTGFSSIETKNALIVDRAPDNNDEALYSADNGRLMIYLSSFKFHPEVQVWRLAVGQSKTKEFIGSIYDIDNFAVISRDEIRKMHETALMSMFSVPSVAKSSTIVSK